jgi:HD-like signal output (HDOD) protein
MDDFARVVKFDPTLSAQLLKIVNSPMYNFRNPVDSISRAVKILGTKSVYDLAIGYGVRDAFTDMDKQCIDLDRYWEYSVRTALFAKYWAEKLSLHEPERFFTAGLLHNIGELVVVRKTPEIALACSRFRTDQQPWEKQIEVMGYTYKDVTETLLKVWGIPAGIIECIKPIHDSPQTIGSIDSKVMQLAYHQALLETYPLFMNDITELPEQYAFSIGISAKALDDSIEHNRFRILTIVSLFMTNSFVSM